MNTYNLHVVEKAWDRTVRDQEQKACNRILMERWGMEWQTEVKKENETFPWANGKADDARHSIRTLVMTTIVTTVVSTLAYTTPTMYPASSYGFLYCKVGGTLKKKWNTAQKIKHVDQIKI